VEGILEIHWDYFIYFLKFVHFIDMFTWFCRVYSAMASNKSPAITTPVHRQVPPPWTTAMLVPEVLDHNFCALEDADMIRWLGREKFMDTCVNGTPGWQDNVRLYIDYLNPLCV